MTYEYLCTPCDNRFDVCKSVAEMDNIEHCPKCKEQAARQFSFRVHFIGAKVTHAEFNPGLGCVVKNEQHKDYLLKSKGLVEVGNDYKTPDNMHKEFETKREDKRKARWDSALEDKS